MARQQPRQKTRYVGVFSLLSADGSKTFFIRYRRPGEGRLIEEKAGSTGPPDMMTAIKANWLRAGKILRKFPTNAEQREQANQVWPD